MRKLINIERVVGVATAILVLAILVPTFHKNNPVKSSVMITNRAGNSGGTGIILDSGESESVVLTNNHVCELVKRAGGLVKSDSGYFQVKATKSSETADLCLITVQDNLRASTKIANKAAKPYSATSIVGHPALMPNVITSGHQSGREIITVMTGVKACTEDEMNNPDTALVCFLLGGFPIIKSYESVLMTATIMPGSSGSGVYNSKKELIGVVFAGQGELGYAWTVPYEQVVDFIYNEAPNLPYKNISQELTLNSQQSERRDVSWKQVRKECLTNTDPTMENFCNILNKDMIWYK